jgi:Flp pilus assembly protein TadD
MDRAKHDELFQKGFGLVVPLESCPVDNDSIREGMESLFEVIKMNPSNWSAHWALGKGYLQLGEHKLAHGCFKQAYNIAKNKPPEHFSDVLRELALSCLLLDRFEEAIYYTDVARKFAPDDYTLDVNHALACFMNKQFDKADHFVQKALLANPSDKSVQNFIKMLSDIRSGERPFIGSFLKMFQDI